MKSKRDNPPWKKTDRNQIIWQKRKKPDWNHSWNLITSWNSECKWLFWARKSVYQQPRTNIAMIHPYSQGTCEIEGLCSPLIVLHIDLFKYTLIDIFSYIKKYNKRQSNMFKSLIQYNNWKIENKKVNCSYMLYVLLVALLHLIMWKLFQRKGMLMLCITIMFYMCFLSWWKARMRSSIKIYVSVMLVFVSRFVNLFFIMGPFYEKRIW